MATEYRLVTERPEHIGSGRRTRSEPKRNWEHARDGLKAYAGRNVLPAGLEPWHAWIETREVTDWERVDLKAKP